MPNFFQDLAERVISTYVQVFLGLVIATWTDAIDMATIKVAAIAAIPAALSVIKGLAAKQFGEADTASLVGASTIPPHGSGD